jgi:hypothetical protein
MCKDSCGAKLPHNTELDEADLCSFTPIWNMRQNLSIDRGSSIRSALIERRRYLVRPNTTSTSTSLAGGL